jgi:peptidoglycan/LPS O-acetylase OafA/YrhL
MRMPSWYRAESEDFLHLDMLRFFASMAIVSFHYVGHAPVSTLVNERVQNLHVAVDLFFVISGVMMGSLYRGRLETTPAYLKFMRKRFARLVPLHYLTFIFFLLAGAAITWLGIKSDHPEAYDPRCILPNILMIHAFGVCSDVTFNAPSWSISAEMGMYAILPVFLWLTRRPLWGFVALGLILVGMGFWNTLTPGVSWSEHTFDGGVIRAVPSFLLGVLLAGQRPRLMKIPHPTVWLAVTSAAFLLACAFLYLPSLPTVSEWVRLLLVYAIVIFALAADDRGRVVQWVRSLAPLGRLTYSTYMLHLPLLLVGSSLIAERILHLQGLWMIIWLGFLGLIVLPALGLVSLVWFETPMRRLLSGGSKPPARRKSLEAEVKVTS